MKIDDLENEKFYVLGERGGRRKMLTQRGRDWKFDCRVGLINEKDLELLKEYVK